MEEVTIAAYNPEWPAEFEREKERLLDALHDIALEIRHIGSTAVPGLAAKPLIDIMVGVRHLDQVDDLHMKRLAALGYVFVHHAEFPERRFFRKGERRAGTHHLHIYVYNSERWNNHKLFTSYLVRHPEAALAYSKLKIRLARQFPDDRAAYTEAKGPFILEQIAKAKAEGEIESAGGLGIQRLSHGETPPYELLLLADPSRGRVDRYLREGACYTAFLAGETTSGRLAGVFVLLSKGDETMEIMSIAVKEELQGKGIGRSLLGAAMEQAAAAGARTIEVGTGNSSLGQLAFYQKYGFRITGVDRDFFVRNYGEDIYENGIHCRDMIRLSYDLNGRA